MDTKEEREETVQEITDMLAFYSVNAVSHAHFIGLKKEDFLSYMGKHFECYEEYKEKTR